MRKLRDKIGKQIDREPGCRLTRARLSGGEGQILKFFHDKI